MTTTLLILFYICLVQCVCFFLYILSWFALLSTYEMLFIPMMIFVSDVWVNTHLFSFLTETCLDILPMYCLKINYGFEVHGKLN